MNELREYRADRSAIDILKSMQSERQERVEGMLCNSETCPASSSRFYSNGTSRYLHRLMKKDTSTLQWKKTDAKLCET